MANSASPRTLRRIVAYLDDIRFPCSPVDILACAEKNEAPDLILDAVEHLPVRVYRNVVDILRRLGGAAEAV